jgi:hypothetical protein
MAKTPTKTETTAPEPAYMEVTLSRMVELQGHRYRPGVKHVVDAATLAAIGDAVATKRPLPR